MTRVPSGRIFAAGILMALAVPARGATPIAPVASPTSGTISIKAPSITPTATNTTAIKPAAVSPTSSTTITSSGPPVAVLGVVMPTPAITAVKPADCVAKGGTVTLEGSNLPMQTGHAVAIDDRNGTHIDLSINSWTATSISASVPDDPRVQEGTSYMVAMESGHGSWVGNVDKSITICATAPAAADSGGTAASPASGGGSLLAGGLPPPPATQSLEGAAVKEDVTVEPGEVIVVSADMNEAQQLQQTAQSMGLAIKRRTPFRNLGLVMSVLRTPKGTTVADVIGQLRKAMPNAWLDANHRYRLQAGGEPRRYATQAIAWDSRTGCGAGLAIGLVDTGIDETHPLFNKRAIIQRSFLASGIVPAPREHGTAIASILVGNEPPGLMPDASLHAATVFRLRNGKEVDTTAEWVVAALDWLVGEKVAVINLSLGGPRNLLVEAAVQRVMDRGIVIVAAAGNGGSDAAPVYPAAQPGVIGVTAIDANLKPYEHANHGSYIAYAAPGVDVWVAAPGGGGVYATGTSYAAPFVTAVAAAAKWSGRANSREGLDALLQSKARDLGPSGRDDVFGWGLIQMPGECVRPLKTAARKKKRG